MHQPRVTPSCWRQGPGLFLFSSGPGSPASRASKHFTFSLTGLGGGGGNARRLWERSLSFEAEPDAKVKIPAGGDWLNRGFRIRFPFLFPTAPATKTLSLPQPTEGRLLRWETNTSPPRRITSGKARGGRGESKQKPNSGELQELPCGKRGSKLPPELVAAASASPARASTAESRRDRARLQLRAAASLGPAPCSGAADRAPPVPRAALGVLRAPGSSGTALRTLRVQTDRGTPSSPVEQRTANRPSVWETPLPSLREERCRTAILQTRVSAISSRVSGPE